MCITPSPTFHRASTDPSKGNFYAIMSNREVDSINAQTYGNRNKIPLNFLGNLVSKLAARYRHTFPRPVQYMNLQPRE